MALTIDVKKDVARMLQPLYQLTPRQYPFIVAKALTNTAQDVKKSLEVEVARVFDRPTPFTKRGMMVRPATKQNLRAEVDLKDFAPKGTASHQYLQPEIMGGPRPLKRFERVLRNAGILPSGYFAVPGDDVQLDQYGNIPRGTITAILSGLKAFGETGYTANRTARSGRKNRRLRPFFAVKREGAGLPMGIYERKGKGRILWFAFVKQPVYKMRLDFYGVAQRVTIESFPKKLKDATDYAMRTSR